GASARNTKAIHPLAARRRPDELASIGPHRRRGEVQVKGRNVWLALGVLLGSYGMVVGGRAAAVAAVRWLSRGEAPARSELLAVVAGGAEERLVSALTLMKQGFAPALLTSEPDRVKQLYERGEREPPSWTLLTCPARVGSTLDDAHCIRQVVVQKEVRSI